MFLFTWDEAFEIELAAVGVRSPCARKLLYSALPTPFMEGENDEDFVHSGVDMLCYYAVPYFTTNNKVPSPVSSPLPTWGERCKWLLHDNAMDGSLRAEVAIARAERDRRACEACVQGATVDVDRCADAPALTPLCSSAWGAAPLADLLRCKVDAAVQYRIVCAKPCGLGVEATA